MLYGLFLSAAGLQAQETRQAVISNNLANAETTGFKRDLAIMQSRANAVDEDARMMPYRIPVMAQQGGGVTLAGAGVDLTQGMLKQTGNDTDVALVGKGFFQVQGSEAGKPTLTRDGRFLINNDGLLVMAASGRPVLGADGQTIKLNPNLPVTITGKGQVTQGEGSLVQMGLVDVPDARRLVKLGNDLLTVDSPEAVKPLPAETLVQQRNLEQSAVDPTIELVNMMEGQRAFDANAKLIGYQDQTLSELNTVGKVA